MLSFLTQILARTVAFVERRRAAAIVVVSLIAFLAAAAGVAAFRPPVLVPVIDTATAWVEVALSQPARLGKYFTSPRASREQVVRLELEIADLREARRENDRLRHMLGYRLRTAHGLVPSRVVALDLNPVRGVAWVNAGRNHGVFGGEAVLTPGGLVGVVEASGAGRSRVRLVRNQLTPVGVRVARTRVLGVVEWEPARGRLSLQYVPHQAEVAVGDTLVSSGLGGVFPAGLPVGRVSAVRGGAGQMLQDIDVEAFAAFHRLEEVFVLVAPAAVIDSMGTVGLGSQYSSASRGAVTDTTAGTSP